MKEGALRERVQKVLAGAGHGSRRKVEQWIREGRLRIDGRKAELGESVETDIYDGAQLTPGNELEGPAVVETVATSIVVHPEQRFLVDRYGNFEIRTGQAR